MDNELFTRRTTCRICGYDRLKTILNLGVTPLADRFISDPNEKEIRFPLVVTVCPKCWLVQLLIDVQDKMLFGEDYGFYCGSSPSSIAYFKDYADDLFAQFPKSANKFVVEIASNDGTLLKNFIEREVKVLGIDPAPNVVSQALIDNIPTLPNFFKKKIAKEISVSYGKASMIIANNVVAHVTDLNDFMQGIKILLSEDGLFVFEVQYVPHLIFNCEFDNVYHEHRSFFSVIALNKLLSQNGLRIFNVQETSAQGGSIRVFAEHKQPLDHDSPILLEYIAQEEELGLNTLAIYQSLQERANYLKLQLVKLLTELYDQGKMVYGYGASAKSNTLLNYCGIDGHLIWVLVDKTPYKYGKLTPGSHIRIVEQGTVPDPDYYLLLVWNYLDGILEREKEFREKGGKFIVPVMHLPKII